MSLSEDLSGAVLNGHYRLDARLAVDGERASYRGHHLHLYQPVQVDVLLGTDPTQRERARREASILYKLRHPGLAEVHDFGCLPDGRPFLVLAALPTDDLAQLLVAGPLAPRRALGIAAQVAAGLAVAHQAQVIHRGLHPGCVVLFPDGQSKLKGFAVATDNAGACLTTDGAVLGVPGYLAPEQARGERVSPAADQYALGCVLFHMLLGRPPFAAPSAAETLLLHQHAAPALPADLPPPIAALLQRLLHKDPAARFPSMADAAARLGALAGAALRLGLLYAPADAALAEKLLAQLAALAQGGLVDLFHPGSLKGGAPTADLERGLAACARVAVLVSAELLASPLAAGLPALRRRAEAGALELVPVLLRPAHLPAPLADLLTLPRDGRAVTQHKDRDVPLRDIAAALAAPLPV